MDADLQGQQQRERGACVCVGGGGGERRPVSMYTCLCSVQQAVHPPYAVFDVHLTLQGAAYVGCVYGDRWGTFMRQNL
jgi:hypothetical protein